MKCLEIGFGTYNCAYNIMLPYLVTHMGDIPLEKPESKRSQSTNACCPKFYPFGSAESKPRAVAVGMENNHRLLEFWMNASPK